MKLPTTEQESQTELFTKAAFSLPGQRRDPGGRVVLPSGAFGFQVDSGILDVTGVF